MSYRPTGVDDVRDISLALGRFRPDERLPRSRKNLGGTSRVEDDRTDRMSPKRSDAVGDLCGTGLTGVE
jgi:hypothetical protein